MGFFGLKMPGYGRAELPRKGVRRAAGTRCWGFRGSDAVATDRGWDRFGVGVLPSGASSAGGEPAVRVDAGEFGTGTVDGGGTGGDVHLANVVLERDMQEIDELSARLVRGTDVDDTALLARMLGLCSKLSAWQWVIHGETLAFRKRVIRWLVEKRKLVLAKRYALCGKGDVLLKNDLDGRARVKPLGCGARFCPRCSRRAGRRHLSRVAAHLSSGPHGSMWHVVLTQPGLPKERIGASRTRFDTAWKAFYPTLRRCGMLSALATYHVKPSEKYGWHYHCHLVVEFDDVVDHDLLRERLSEKWRASTSSPARDDRKEVFMRLVADAGPALVGMKENTQLDFWDEPQDQVECVLHYVLRDVLQGVEKWALAMEREEDCFDFCDFMGTAKRHRTYGKWRKGVPGDDTESRDASEDNGTVTAELAATKASRERMEWSRIDTMDGCLHTLRTGCEESRRLVLSLIGCTSRGVGQLFRLRKVVASIAA